MLMLAKGGRERRSVIGGGEGNTYALNGKDPGSGLGKAFLTLGLPATVIVAFLY
jgi:hypothetical protein